MIQRYLSLVLVGAALIAVAPDSRANKTETWVGQTIVGSSAPGANQATYYASAFQYSNDGQQGLLYVQGDDDLLADPRYVPNATYDGIFLYRNPNTWIGLTTPFQRIKTILPDAAQGHPAWDAATQTMWFYGHPGVTKQGGKFYLVATNLPMRSSFNVNCGECPATAKTLLGIH